MQPSTREDVTEKWSSFQMTFTNVIGCGWFYFKNRSPSCGTRDVKFILVLKKRQQKEKDQAYWRSSNKKIFASSY